MNILDKTINRIKQFLNRNKTKALPAGKELTQYGEIYPETQITVVHSAKEALKQNWVLGEQERLKRDFIENQRYELHEIFSALIDSEFKYDSPLQRQCIIADQSSYISTIIGSYIEGKIISNRLDYNSIAVDSSEIISFIRHLEGIGFSKKLDDDEWYLKEMKEIEDGVYGTKKEVFEYYSSELNPEYIEIFESLTEEQKKYFVTQKRSALELFYGLSLEQINVLKRMNIKGLNFLVSLESNQQQFFKQLTPEQLDAFSKLSTNQLNAFMLLSENSKNIFARKSTEDPSYFMNMINAISIYMKETQNEFNDIKYDMYKKFLDTDNGKKYLSLNLDIMKNRLDTFRIVGKKEAYRSRLLRTTDLNTELPLALKGTYKSTEDYIEKSSTDIYKPLMHLAGLIGATEVQKQILRNTVEDILKDKKMIVPYDNPENENCISYKTVEDKVGIKLNIEAIILLSSFCNTYLYNKVEDKPHSIIIATHRKPECAYFTYEGEERIDLSEDSAKEMLEEGKKVYRSCKGNITLYHGNESQETMYDRFTDGKMIPSYEVSDDEIRKYAETRKHMGLSEGETIVPNNIENYQDLISLMEGLGKANYYTCFDALLKSKLLRNLPNSAKLTDEEKSYIDIFKEDDEYGNIQNGVYTEALITPLSFSEDYEETPGLEEHEKGKAMIAHMREESKKVNGLRECIDEIITSFNSGSIGNISIRNSFFGKSQRNLKERFERILVQGISAGLITDKDYFDCMTTMQCMMELNKVRLSPEETLSYVIASAGGTPSSSTKTKEQRYH